MLRELVTKELAMLIVIAAIGSGVARTLRGRIDAGSQLALAPVFGYAISIGLLVSINFVVPLRHALWFALVPLALISIGFALWQGGIPRDWRPHWQTLVQLGIVLVAVLAMLNAPLQRRDSAGPIAWGIYDAPGYTDCIAGFQSQTTSDSLLGKPPADWPQPSHDAEAWKPSWNLGLRYCWAYRFQHMGGMALPSATAGGVGWWPWEMLSPYMALCVLLASLGSFALFRVLTRSRSWLSIAPALAAAGAPLFQLYIDGSAGLLGGIALVPALLTVGLLVFREPGWRSSLLGGVLVAGLIAAYPEMGALVVGATGLALLVRLALNVRSGAKLGDQLRFAVPLILGAAALAIVLALRATLWAIADLRETGTFASKGAAGLGLIHYNFSIPHLLGYLLQTREFYSFSLSNPSGFTYFCVGILLPLAMIAVALYGCIRKRGGSWLILVFIVVAVAQSLYSAVHLNCSYCVGRTLLTTIPSIAVLVTLGVYELMRSNDRRNLILAVAVGTTAAIAAVTALWGMEERAYHGAYMASNSLSVMSEQAENLVDGPIEIEGFGQTPLWSWGEGRTTYQAMEEATGERVSVDSAYDDWGGLAYFNTRLPGDPSFDPNYQYVLTRLTGLDTGRETLVENGTIALQRRLTPFDVTVARGVAVENYVRDPSGAVWVQRPGMEEGLEQGPLTFWVSALSSGKAYLRAEFSGPPELRPVNVSGAVTRTTAEGHVEVCMPVPGTGKLRIATMPLRPLPEPVTYPLGMPFSTTLGDENAPLAAKEIQLLKDRVDSTPCAQRSSGAGRSSR